VTRIDQVLGSAAPYDATNAQAFAYRDLFAGMGIDGGVFAAESAGAVEPLAALGRDSRDLLLVHYTGYVPGMRAVLELAGPKLLVYHNVTPARYFWNLQPYVATICQVGRDQLPRWVEAAAVTAAVSRFNAAELERAGASKPRVVPILLERARLEPVAAGAPIPAGRPLVLVVGRLSPHKRHDRVLRAFALYQRRHAPDAALLCVGSALDPAFRRRLERIAAECGARNVALAEDLAQPELNAAYASADVLLSLSEHEGFCVPLLEAFHFGVPVVARPAGGMVEVGGDAVLWADDDELAVVAELLRLAVEDAELRGELRRRGGERLARYSFEAVASELRAVVGEALGDHSATPAPRSSMVRRDERSGPGTPRAIR
jgi:L-malate glycosyltransferase